MRDTVFKQAISILPIGSGVRIEGPMGSFSLHNNTARLAVFLAGGIGIAPFLSMLSHAREEKLHHPIVLFYANRYLEDAAFIDELWRLERANPRFRFVPILTRTDKNCRGWKGRLDTSARKCFSHTWESCEARSITSLGRRRWLRRRAERSVRWV